MRTFVRLALAVALGAAIAVPNVVKPNRVAAVSCGPCPATTTDRLNLREGPGLDDAVILVMPAFVNLEYDPAAGVHNGYVAVTYDGVDGWASTDYLWLWPGFGVTTSELNLRAEPDLGAEVVAVMPSSADLQILSGPENGFFSVNYNETVGWAWTEYIVVDQSTDVPPDAGDFSPGDNVVVATDRLNLRSGPTLAADAIDVLVSGTFATVLDGPVSAGNYAWFEIDVDGGTTGWVAGDFLSLANTDGQGIPVGAGVDVNTDRLNLRADPGLDADVLTVLPTGAYGTVLEPPAGVDGYVWYRVNFGSDYGTGWVAGDFLAVVVEDGGFAIGDEVAVNTVDGLHARTGPGLDYEVMATWPDGQAGAITYGPVYADGYTWWEVSPEGDGPGDFAPGWVAGDFVVQI